MSFTSLSTYLHHLKLCESCHWYFWNIFQQSFSLFATSWQVHWNIIFPCISTKRLFKQHFCYILMLNIFSIFAFLLRKVNCWIFWRREIFIFSLNANRFKRDLIFKEKKMFFQILSDRTFSHSFSFCFLTDYFQLFAMLFKMSYQRLNENVNFSYSFVFPWKFMLNNTSNKSNVAIDDIVYLFVSPFPSLSNNFNSWWLISPFLSFNFSFTFLLFPFINLWKSSFFVETSTLSSLVYLYFAWQ